MRRHRWGWRIAVITPAVVVAGAAAAGLAAAGPALASGASSSPSPCPSQGVLGGITKTACQTVKSLPSPGNVLPSPVASAVSSAGSTVGSTVGTVTGVLGGSGTGSSTGSTSPGGTTSHSGGGSTTRSSGSGSHSAKSSRSHTSRASGSVSALGSAVGSPNLGVLSSLGVPGWLVRGGLGALPGSTVPLSFPVVHPGTAGKGSTVAQASVQPASRAVSSLWLVFAIGVACLVGVAGGLGRFENRRRGARRTPS